MEVLAVFGSAFLFGMASSGHCTLMCGPVQAAWLGTAKPALVLRYHLGRWVAYATIGLVIQFVFVPMSWLINTANLTLMLGISMFFGALLFFTMEYLLPPAATKPLLQLGSWAGTLPMVSRMWFFGALNGFLPCGMVWMAAGMSAAFSANLITLGLLSAFWLGTLPALLGLNVIFTRLQGILAFTGSKRWVLPALLMIVGVMLSYRGIVYGNQWMNTTANEPTQECVPIP